MRCERALRRRPAAAIGLSLAFGVAATAVGAIGCGGAKSTNATSTNTAAGGTATASAKSGAAWKDATYVRSPTTLVDLAILPVGQSGIAAERFDQGMERVFAVTEAMTLRTRPYDIRSAMNASHDLVQWVSRIQSTTWTAPDLAAKPNLSRVLEWREIEGLHKVVRSNLMIAPVAFELKTEGQQTKGTATYHAYELPTGKLLRINSFEVSVPETGEPGERNATVELILQIQSDFAKNLL